MQTYSTLDTSASVYHLCLSASNKVRMLEDGVTERIKTLLRSDMPPVQFKLLGTLRMMVDGQGEFNCLKVRMKVMAFSTSQ